MSEKGWLKHFLSTIDRVDEVSNTDDVAALVIVSREAADEVERLNAKIEKLWHTNEMLETTDPAMLVAGLRLKDDEIERLREALIDIRDNNWLSEIDGVAVGRSAYEIAANALTPTPEALP